MKKRMSLILIAGTIGIVACGPNAAEKAKKEAEAKANMDSLFSAASRSSNAAKAADSKESNSSSSSSEDKTAEKTSVASSNEDFDKMLNDYEEYVDEYIKFYKKAMKGDQSAMAEYPSMMAKATTLSESMAKAQKNNQLSATQLTRMVKIQTKMVQGLTSN